MPGSVGDHRSTSGDGGNAGRRRDNWSPSCGSRWNTGGCYRCSRCWRCLVRNGAVAVVIGIRVWIRVSVWIGIRIRVWIPIIRISAPPSAPTITRPETAYAEEEAVPAVKPVAVMESTAVKTAVESATVETATSRKAAAHSHAAASKTAATRAPSSEAAMTAAMALR